MSKTNKKFSSSMLLMGKVATLPMLISQAHADVTPTYQDVTSTQLSLIELPQTNQLRLVSLTADAANQSSSYASAILCTNPMPSSMSVVVTGVNPGESVYLFASTDKNYSGHTSLNPRASIGATNLALLGISGLAPSSPTSIKAAVSIPVSLASNPDLTSASSFYMQAIIVPPGATSPASWRFTELDEVRKGTVSTNSYGQTTSYCN